MGEARQCGQMAARGCAGKRHEVSVAAESIDVGPGPGDGGFDVLDVAGPSVPRRNAVIDRQAHPALCGQMRHQRVPLQDAAAVHPGAAGNKDQHRGRLDGQILASPHIEHLLRGVAVANGASEKITATMGSRP